MHGKKQTSQWDDSFAESASRNGRFDTVRSQPEQTEAGEDVKGAQYVAVQAAGFVMGTTWSQVSEFAERSPATTPK
jgi:hypothetical protein